MAQKYKVKAEAEQNNKNRIKIHRHNAIENVLYDEYKRNPWYSLGI